ncbi:MAG: hypothetical protein NC548_32680 [Lachnospiraceae bacterium]|nr:hypothetical protein [Lachnospiraceae bacterium]
MSHPGFEMVSNILDIRKIAIQAIMFLVLWAAVFDVKKGKRDGIAAVLFILVNVGLGFLPCASWVRYAVLAFAARGYGGIICHKESRQESEADEYGVGKGSETG